jgi:hypothetical protein
MLWRREKSAHAGNQTTIPQTFTSGAKCQEQVTWKSTEYSRNWGADINVVHQTQSNSPKLKYISEQGKSTCNAYSTVHYQTDHRAVHDMWLDACEPAEFCTLFLDCVLIYLLSEQTVVSLWLKTKSFKLNPVPTAATARDYPCALLMDTANARYSGMVQKWDYQPL